MFQFENKLLPILSYIEELEFGPDLAHSGHERRLGNWSKSPVKEYISQIHQQNVKAFLKNLL